MSYLPLKLNPKAATAAAFMRAPCSRNAHPLVKQFMRIVADEDICMRTLYELSGVGHDVVYRWRDGGSVNLNKLEYVLQVLGYRIVMEKIPET